MRVFKVGGCVRDEVMGIPNHDTDWLVVGATSQDMIKMGFTEVGNDFGVWLHPITNDEWALARRERSTGTKHTDFEVELEDVTLEQDLARRDLTINTLCIEVDLNTLEPITGDIIDIFGGLNDIRDKTLRHVSDAFKEDPLRILRVARFLARFGDFTIAKETVEFLVEMISDGVLESLAIERVWLETEKALMSKHPRLFFETLKGSGLFIELDALEGVHQRLDFHPESCSFIHTLLCLQAAAKMNLTLEERFAVLCHDFGKKPAHVFNTAQGKGHLGGHEAMGVPLIEAFCERFKVPNDCSWLAKTVARDHTNIHNFKKLKPNTIGKMFARWDILRHPERALQIMNCCTADGRGRGETHENNIHPTFDILPHFVAAWLDKVDVEGMVAAGVARGKKWTGQAIGEAVLRERVRRLTEVKKQLEANV